MKRVYFRLDLDKPLVSEMTIIRIKENKIETGSSKVLIDNIGPGGLRFISTLQLPVNPHLVLQFQVTLLNNPIKLLGYTVRKEELEGGLLQYGVSFTIDEEVRLALIRILNDLQIRSRRGVKLTEGPEFYLGDLDKFFAEDSFL